MQKFGKVLQDRRQLVGPPYESGSIDVTYFDSEGNDKKDTQMGTQAKYIVVDASLVQGDMRAYHELHERDMQARVAVTEFEVDKVLWEMKKMGELEKMKKIYPNPNLVYPPHISLELAQWMLDLTCQTENDAGTWYFASALSVMEDVVRREHPPKVPPPLPTRSAQTKGNHVEAMQSYWADKFEAGEIDKAEYEAKMAEYQKQLAALGEPSSGGDVDASDTSTDDLHMAASDNDVHEVQSPQPITPAQTVESVPALKVEVIEPKVDAESNDDDDSSNSGNIVLPKKPKKPGIFGSTELAEWKNQMAALGLPTSDGDDESPDTTETDAQKTENKPDTNEVQSPQLITPTEAADPSVNEDDIDIDQPLEPGAPTEMELPTTNDKNDLQPVMATSTSANDHDEMAEYNKQMEAFGLPTSDLDDESPDTTTTDAQKTDNKPDPNEVQSPPPTTPTEAADPTLSEKGDIEPKVPS